MLKANRKLVDMFLLIWVIMSGICYFIVYDGEPTMAMVMIAVTFIPTILVILMVIKIDKDDRLENSKELRIHRLIHATIDGVIEVQSSRENNIYKAYTESDLYIVEYGEKTSRIIHVGPYQRIDMKG